MTSFPYVPVYHTGPKVHIFCVPNKINLHQNWIQYVKRDDFISSKNSIASKTSIITDSLNMISNKFQYKLFKAANECKSGAIRWSNYGDSIIFNFPQFKKEYLEPNDNFSKSCHLSSFVRQLNLYGFRKMLDLTRTSSLNENHIKEYINGNFVKGREDLLHFVTRNHASPSLELNRPIKQEVLSDDEIEKENELVKVPCNKERETCRVHKKNSRRGRKYRKVIKKEVVEEHDEVLQKSCSVNATENKKENCTTFHEISNIDFSSDLLHQESSSSKVLNDQDEKKVNNYVNDNKNSYSFITDNGKVSSENSGEVDNNLSYFDDYMILSGPIPEYDPTYKRPNKHWEDMCKVAENLGINVEAVLRRAEEERKNRSACATFKFTRPTLKLLSMQFETDKKTVFLKRGSNHVFMRRPSYKRFYYYK